MYIYNYRYFFNVCLAISHHSVSKQSLLCYFFILFLVRSYCVHSCLGILYLVIADIFRKISYFSTFKLILCKLEILYFRGVKA